jgi:CRP/FNR family cyclic AMP-dependent transcriptional regulator
MTEPTPTSQDIVSAGLSADEKIEAFFSKYPLRIYGDGQIFLLPHDKLTCVYYVVEGYVRVFDVSSHGNEVVVNIFSPESVFPMSKVLNKTHNDYFYQASTTLKTRQAPPEDLIEFLSSNGDVSFELLSRSYLNAQIMRRRMAHLMGGSARNRLAYELIVLAHRFGHPDVNDKYLVTINESEIGARSGLSRETVSREIKTLKSTDLLSVTSNGIILHSIKSLEHKLGSEL